MSNLKLIPILGLSIFFPPSATEFDIALTWRHHSQLSLSIRSLLLLGARTEDNAKNIIVGRLTLRLWYRFMWHNLKVAQISCPLQSGIMRVMPPCTYSGDKGLGSQSLDPHILVRRDFWPCRSFPSAEREKSHRCVSRGKSSIGAYSLKRLLESTCEKERNSKISLGRKASKRFVAFWGLGPRVSLLELCGDNAHHYCLFQEQQSLDMVCLVHWHKLPW